MKRQSLKRTNYYNNCNRSLFQSILFENVSIALKTLLKHNDTSEIMLIGGLTISYYSKPYTSHDIDILVKDKSTIKINNFFNNIHENGTKLDIYDKKDLNLTDEDFDRILNTCNKQNGINIPNQTEMVYLLLKEKNLHNNFRLEFLLTNSHINLKKLSNLLTDYDNKYLNNFLIYINKNYRMKYIKTFDMFNTCRIYEGTSGIPQVDTAFYDWINNVNNKNQVLIGGMAMVNYGSDRSTTDADFIFMTENDIPTYVNKFKKVRPHAFRHVSTHVEIETLSPEFLGLDKNLAEIVFRTSFDKKDYRIASPSSIVALKLDRLSMTDIKDISLLYKNFEINLDEYIPFLSDKAINNLNTLNDIIENK